jgi:hypothetical protein
VVEVEYLKFLLVEHIQVMEVVMLAVHRILLAQAMESTQEMAVTGLVLAVGAMGLLEVVEAVVVVVVE